MEIRPADLKVGDVIRFWPDDDGQVTDEVTYVQTLPDGDHIVVTRTGRVDRMMAGAAVQRLDTVATEKWRAEQERQERRQAITHGLLKMAHAVEDRTIEPAHVTVIAALPDWQEMQHAAHAHPDAQVRVVNGWGVLSLIDDPLGPISICLQARSPEGAA